MRAMTLLVFLYVSQLAGAAPNENKEHELNRWHPLQAQYKIHSGSTAYSESPTKADSALTVAFNGEPARRLFEQIGPDVKNSCGVTDQGDRRRKKKGILCLYETQLDGPGDSHYRCWIGIDLNTGDGDVRVPC